MRKKLVRKIKTQRTQRLLMPPMLYAATYLIAIYRYLNLGLTTSILNITHPATDFISFLSENTPNIDIDNIIYG